MKTPAKLLVVLCVSTLVATSVLKGQETPPIQNQPTLYSFNCHDAALEVLLDRLQDLTGKDITVDLGVKARFTLATTEKVTATELIDIITRALNAQDIHLDNIDENTIRVRGKPKLNTPPIHYESRETAMKGIAELKAQRQSVQQGGPGYPSQGAGSPDP